MATKKEFLAQKVSRAVGAGKIVEMETVDFGDPQRPKTCLEVDFPILSVNQVAAIEGNAGKPIYQMAKWWARRRSSVFRSMLIAAATKAPADPSHAAKLVWDNYYANHQRKGAFKNLKVADIFMGGGTTLVEGARLGMQMLGNDLNPIAWFVVKQALAEVKLEDIKLLLADVEAEVKPQVMPFYYCDGPNGEKGIWTHKTSGKKMGPDFDPLAIEPDKRKDYDYEGPEIVYTFWAKHGPCHVTGCGHRTPIVNNPVMAIKSLTVKYWRHHCTKCYTNFHIEDRVVRMAPDAPLFNSPDEYLYSTLDPKRGVICPNCDFSEFVKLGKSQNKKVEMSLLIHPEWLDGCPKSDSDGSLFGGSATDDAKLSANWHRRRAEKIRLLEVRGVLPDTVTCPATHVSFSTGTEGGNVPKKAHFTCRQCGTQQDVLESVKGTGKTGPMAAYAIQGHSNLTAKNGDAYNGRFFAPYDERYSRQYIAAQAEWDARRLTDLHEYWPKSELPYGFMTHLLQGGLPNHGFTHWWTMFNPRQLLVHSLLLKAILTVGDHDWSTREVLLCSFQQYLNYQTMFAFWHTKLDKLNPMFASNNFHPKPNVVEVGVFSPVGYGPWSSTVEVLSRALNWKQNPWELAAVENIRKLSPELAEECSGKSEKAFPSDPPIRAEIMQGSSTELAFYDSGSIDLVITDPPFGGLLHYSELSDFFYVWLRLALKDRYPDQFSAEYTPKSMEAVANRAREPSDADGFYKRLLTQCWREAHRILKPGGILSFTFHHSADEPWIAVLESLFEAGFYLEATYPIRSDETKGEGAKPGNFGSQTIEYDIIHVCRKRTEEPRPVSWGRMRREVLADVRQLQGMLENHARAGLPPADLQVIRRGKALEYFSRHFGKVYVDEGRPISVKEALLGINQLIDEDTYKTSDPPPVTAEPTTRQFLRIFDGKTELPRDQLQKLLRGSGITPDEFITRGWTIEAKKVVHLVDPAEFARDWQGKHRRKLTADLDQALVLMGACYDGSGINASDTLKNDNFKPHPALKGLLEWFGKRAPNQAMRNASIRALSIYNAWAASNKDVVVQMSLFLED